MVCSGKLWWLCLAITLLIATVLGLFLIGYFSRRNTVSSSPASSTSTSEIGGTSGKSVVLFWANWCGACKRLMPQWNIAKERLAQLGFKVVEYEHSNDRNVIDTYSKATGLNGYPTIRIYTSYPSPSGQYIEYNGTRQADDIVMFCMKNV